MQIANGWRPALLGLFAFALLLGLECWEEGGMLPPMELVGEVLQTGLLVTAACGTTFALSRLKDQREENASLLQELDHARSEGEHWRSEVRSHLAGIAAGVERQFRDWSLTHAEKEVGLLMRKGFSHKEIASLRETSEATVRQQARAIYQKAGLGGRASFCAYFLEDLLPPAVDTVSSLHDGGEVS